MTMVQNNLIETTVLKLMEKLESSSLVYAVLKPFEDYPNLGHHLAIVLDVSDRVRFRQILMELARTLGWDALVESQKFGVFRFYNTEIQDFLEIQVFHELLFGDLPFLCSGEILEQRIFDERGFYRVGALVEHWVLLEKIELLLLRELDSSIKEFEMDQERLCSFKEQEDNGFQAFLDSHLMNSISSSFSSSSSSALLATLDSRLDDAFLSAFLELRNLWKRHFLLKFPFQFFVLECSYFLKTLQRNLFSPDGFVLWVHAPEEEDKAFLRETLQWMTDETILSRFWIDDASSRRMNLYERKILDQGALVIKWSRRRNRRGVLNVTRSNSVESLGMNVQHLLKAQCRGLYLKEKRKR